MIQTALTKEDATNWVAETSEPDSVADRREVVDAMPAKAVPHPERPCVAATVLQFEQGLYAVEIGEAVGLTGQFSGLQAPMIQLSAPPVDHDRSVEIINASVRGDLWLGRDGGGVGRRWTTPSSGDAILIRLLQRISQLRGVPGAVG